MTEELATLTEQGLMDVDPSDGGQVASSPQAEVLLPPSEPEKAESPGQPQDKGQKVEWDKERQRRDQEHANERKQLYSQIENMQSERQTFQAQIDELRERLDKKPEPADDIPDELPVDVDYETLVKHDSKLGKLLKNQQREIAGLRKELSSVAGSYRQDADKQAEQQMLSGLSKEFGAELQNDAQIAAGQWLAQQGYSAASPPDRTTTYLALRLAYMALKEKTGKEKPATKTGIALDTGTGGRAPQQSIGEFDNVDDAAEALIKAGKIKL